jgi:hypothetical protein
MQSFCNLVVFVALSLFGTAFAACMPEYSEPLLIVQNDDLAGGDHLAGAYILHHLSVENYYSCAGRLTGFSLSGGESVSANGKNVSISLYVTDIKTGEQHKFKATDTSANCAIVPGIVCTREEQKTSSHYKTITWHISSAEL